MRHRISTRCLCMSRRQKHCELWRTKGSTPIQRHPVHKASRPITPRTGHEHATEANTRVSVVRVSRLRFNTEFWSSTPARIPKKITNSKRKGCSVSDVDIRRGRTKAHERNARDALRRKTPEHKKKNSYDVGRYVPLVDFRPTTTRDTGFGYTTAHDTSFPQPRCRPGTGFHAATNVTVYPQKYSGKDNPSHPTQKRTARNSRLAYRVSDSAEVVVD